MVPILALEEAIHENRTALNALSRSSMLFEQMADGLIYIGSKKEFSPTEENFLEVAKASVEYVAGIESLGDIARSTKAVFERIYDYFLKMVKRVTVLLKLTTNKEEKKAKKVADEAVKKTNTVLKVVDKENIVEVQSRLTAVKAMSRSGGGVIPVINSVGEARSALATALRFSDQDTIDQHNREEKKRAEKGGNGYLFAGAKNEHDLDMLMDDTLRAVMAMRTYASNFNAIIESIFSIKDKNDWIRAGRQFYSWVQSSKLSLREENYKWLNGSTIKFKSKAIKINQGDIDEYFIAEFEIDRRPRPAQIPVLRGIEREAFGKASIATMNKVRVILDEATLKFSEAITILESSSPKGVTGIDYIIQDLANVIAEHELDTDPTIANKLKGLKVFMLKMYTLAPSQFKLIGDIHSFINELHIAILNFPFIETRRS